MTIQWYPGHMAKTVRQIRENLKHTDVVIEVADARIPSSSRNPMLSELAQNKAMFLVLNKSDMADPDKNEAWARYYRKIGVNVFLTDSISGKGITEMLLQIKKSMNVIEQNQKNKGRIHRSIKLMVGGIPNSGKSTFINTIAGKKTAKTEDRPGVTMSLQWVRINEDFSLLDLPGVLPRKFINETDGYMVALAGSIKDSILDDKQLLSLKLINILRKSYSGVLENRYRIEIGADESDAEVFEKIARARGFLQKGNQTDGDRCADMLLDEFRSTKLGRITLEAPPK